jgi:hypothetical protein
MGLEVYKEVVMIVCVPFACYYRAIQVDFGDVAAACYFGDVAASDDYVVVVVVVVVVVAVVVIAVDGVTDYNAVEIHYLRSFGFVVSFDSITNYSVRPGFDMNYCLTPCHIEQH